MLRWLIDQARGRKPTMLAVGERAPQFALLDHNERSVSLTDLKGKRFLLWFYPKAGTPG